MGTSHEQPDAAVEDRHAQRELAIAAPSSKESILYPQSLVALRCRISRSGFPDERVFRVTLANGSEHVGAAPANYFFTEDQHPLPAEQPVQRLVRILGYVAARVIQRKADGSLLLSVPLDDVLLVSPSEVIPYPANGSLTETTAHVPVQP
jgi:hypothetical protein